MKDLVKNFLFVLLIFLLISALFSLFARPFEKEKELSLSQLVGEINQEKIKKIIVSGNELQIIYQDDSQAKSRKEVEAPLSESLLNFGVDKEKLAKIEIETREVVGTWAWLGPVLFTILPLLLIGFFFWLIFRQARTGAMQAFDFTKARARLFGAEGYPKEKITFRDVAGLKEAKEELKEVVDFLKNPKKYLAMGAKIPKGVLLIGPAGTGKTLLARAVAGESNVPFISIAGSSLVELFVGVGASVSGDTPILIKNENQTKLLPIAEFVDQFYWQGEEGFRPVFGLKTLGYKPLERKFWGISKTKFFGKSCWQEVKGVYRHRVNEIYEIHYLDGKIKTTGDHSLFVRQGNFIKPKKVSELKIGDVLVNLSFGDYTAPEFLWELPKEYFLSYLEGLTKGGFNSIKGELAGGRLSKQLILELTWLAAMHGIETGGSQKGRVIKIVKKPYQGYVYDLCGCENEAFFGGEEPILLHNSRVRDLFATAKKNQPAIIFFDELDAIGKVRGPAITGGHEEREQTLNQLLTEMDGFEPNDKIVILAATNRPDVLDPALLRPGRFDRKVVLDLPDVNEREEILKIHCRGKPLALNVNLREVAERTPGFSGADLANLVNEAAILAARRNKIQVFQEELLESIEKVLLGPERKSHILSKKEKKIAAYHEAGHALVASSLPEAEPVRKISIIARGMAAGYTLKMPAEERKIKTKSEFLAEMATLLGGYCAERISFGEITTGAANDLERASLLAGKLVKEYGMSDLGPISFGEREEMTFLGREFERRTYSEEIAAKIDKEIEKFVKNAEKTAKEILTKKKNLLKKIARRLIEKETIEREELVELIGRKKSEKTSILPKKREMVKVKIRQLQERT